MFVIGCVDVIPVTETVSEQYEVFKYDQFAKLSLLTKVEVIQAIVKVRAECNKVTAMSLFHVPTTKHMRLEEFEQAQAQASSQVKLQSTPLKLVYAKTGCKGLRCCKKVLVPILCIALSSRIKSFTFSQRKLNRLVHIALKLV